MANVAALKKKAADFEQKKQLDRAIATYREILDIYDSGGDDNIDVGLYNRVADLLLRQGATPEAVTLFERAVDLYTEGGFFNNAIALCNKILRTSPGRASVYYKLGKISAAKGFKGDAKQNFLEYADRMQKSGQIQEAFRALKEFADLCPDQDDIRLLLAEQLTKADRKSEALEQLQLLYQRYDSEGRATEAQATIERMKAIDPNAEVRSSESRPSVARSDDDLVFLDLNAPTGTLTPRRPFGPPPKRLPDPSLPLIELDTAPRPAPVREPTPALEGLETTALVNETKTQRTPLPASEFAQIDLSAIPEVATGASKRDFVVRGDLPALRTSGNEEGSWSEFRTIEPTPISSVAEAAGAGNERLIGESLPDIERPDSAEPRSSDGLPPGVPLEAPERESPAASASATPDSPAEFHAIPSERVEDPPEVHRASSPLADSVADLAARVEGAPADWGLRRSYAESLLESGDREGGLRELEKALVGSERADDLDTARALAEEIIRLKPGSVRHHQKRVEYAFRSSDRARLSEAYVELADALFRDGQESKAKIVYERVLEIVPDDARALAALEAYAAGERSRGQETEVRSATPPAGQRYTGHDATPPAAALVPVSAASDDDDYVSLGDWLRAEEGPKSTRMVVAEEEPTGDEQKDFEDMLRKFKQGVAANVDEEDHAAHYDLGVAYKEMGLLDEAIAQFQKAFRGNAHRVRTYEALGQCFLEKKQLQVALTLLQRALHEPGVGDEQLVGVLYLLGYIHESQGRQADARGYYERVFAVDIQFRDVGVRLESVEKALA